MLGVMGSRAAPAWAEGVHLMPFSTYSSREKTPGPPPFQACLDLGMA
jgi:hypothetical protein